MKVLCIHIVTGYDKYVYRYYLYCFLSGVGQKNRKFCRFVIGVIVIVRWPYAKDRDTVQIENVYFPTPWQLSKIQKNSSFSFSPGPDCPSTQAAETGDVDPCKCVGNVMDWFCNREKYNKKLCLYIYIYI